MRVSDPDPIEGILYDTADAGLLQDETRRNIDLSLGSVKYAHCPPPPLLETEDGGSREQTRLLDKCSCTMSILSILATSHHSFSYFHGIDVETLFC